MSYRRGSAIVYGIGWVFVAIIRLPVRWRARTVRIIDDRKSLQERVLLALVGIGMGGLPILSICTPLLAFANYQPRPRAGWAGAVVFAAADWLLWRSHVDLGRNWSESLQLRQDHRLVTTGVYRRIRHPMYAAGWLLGIAQALLIPNAVAGGAGLASFALLYFLRSPREERMMLDRFGADYRSYMDRTGRVVPRRLRG